MTDDRINTELNPNIINKNENNIIGSLIILYI